MKTKKDICYSKIVVFHFCVKQKNEYYGNLDEKR